MKLADIEHEMKDAKLRKSCKASSARNERRNWTIVVNIMINSNIQIKQ